MPGEGTVGLTFTQHLHDPFGDLGIT